MQTTAQQVVAPDSVWRWKPSPDVWWDRGALDVEPEQCFCLSCGEALPCMTCRVKSTTKQKEAPYV